MILDKLNMFSDALALTATATSDVIDLGVSRDIGVGRPLEVICLVNTALLSAGSTTLVVKLQTDTQSSFGTAVDLITTAAIAKATLIAGYEVIKQKLPQGVQRYLRVSYTVAVSDFTGGTITAALNLDKQALAYPASGLNTSGY